MGTPETEPDFTDGMDREELAHGLHMAKAEIDNLQVKLTEARADKCPKDIGACPFGDWFGKNKEVADLKAKLKEYEKVVEYISNQERDDSFEWRVREIIDAVKDGWFYICLECNAPTSCSSDSCWNCSAENTGG